jgi:hypothetical protein
LRSAGFSEVHEEATLVDWTWPGSAGELWEQVQAVAAPLRGLLERVPMGDWPEINARVAKALEPFTDKDGVHFQAEIVLASGKKS